MATKVFSNKKDVIYVGRRQAEGLVETLSESSQRFGSPQAFLVAAGLIAFAFAGFLRAPALETGSPAPIRQGGLDLASEPGWSSSAFRSHMWWLVENVGPVHVSRVGFQNGQVGLLSMPAGGLGGLSAAGFSRDFSEPPIDFRPIGQDDYQYLMALNKAIPEAIILCRTEQNGPQQKCPVRVIWDTLPGNDEQLNFVGVRLSEDEMALMEFGLLTEFLATG